MKTNSISDGLAVHARTFATTRQLSFSRAWLWTGFLAFATIAFGPQPAQAAVTEAWVQRYNGPGNSYDRASAVAVDGSGNVFVTGNSGGDYATIAYSGAGVPLWTNRYNANGYDGFATAMAVDASGNVFVTGNSYDDSGGDWDYATIAYSGAGVPLWTNRYDGPGNSYDAAAAVAVDGGGNVFVTGYSVVSGGSEDYATIAYSGAGVPLWTNHYDGPQSAWDRATAVAVGASGNVFVTGYSSDGSGFYSDYATIAYSGAGVPLWTNHYDGPQSAWNRATAVAVDASGNVFVTGSSVGSGGDWDYATIAYSGAGVPLWTSHYHYNPENSSDQATAVAVDGSGNVFVTGSSDADYATIKYSGAGVPLWTNRYNGPANSHDQATAVAVDGSGNVFVTGFSHGSGGDRDYATIAYSGAGVPLGTNRYNGSGNGQGPQTKSSLAIGSDGAVYVTGASDGDFVTVKYVWQPEIAIQLLSTIPPKVDLTLSAAPNSSWAIERALDLTGPWTNLSALLIGTNGSAQFQDTNSPSPAGFYRARQ